MQNHSEISSVYSTYILVNFVFSVNRKLLFFYCTLSFRNDDRSDKCNAMLYCLVLHVCDVKAYSVYPIQGTAYSIVQSMWMVTTVQLFLARCIVAYTFCKCFLVPILRLLTFIPSVCANMFVCLFVCLPLCRVRMCILKFGSFAFRIRDLLSQMNFCLQCPIYTRTVPYSNVFFSFLL